MKLKKLILGLAVALAVSFGAAGPVRAYSTNYPVVPVQISGIMNYTPNYQNGLSQEVPMKSVRYTTVTLIKLLNASLEASNTVFTITGKTNIPNGSYFVVSVYDGQLYITNKNGFFFPMQGSSPSYDYGSLKLNQNGLIGTYNVSSSDFSGNETDQTGVAYTFSDSQGPDANRIAVYGTGRLDWGYGSATGGYHKTTLRVTFTSQGGVSGQVYGYDAAPGAFSAIGSGTQDNQPASTNTIPFYYNFFSNN